MEKRIFLNPSLVLGSKNTRADKEHVKWTHKEKGLQQG